MKNRRNLLALVIPAFVGLLIFIAAPGCRFSGLICFALTGWLGVYWLLRLLEKRHPRTAIWLRRCLSGATVIVLVTAAITWGVIFHESKGVDGDAECAYVVVLGAGVNGTEPSMSLRERLDAAQTYLAAHPNTVCIVSGGQGSGEALTEAECMYNWLTAHDIAPERVWLEPAASNTRENLRFSLDLIEERTGIRPTSIGVVSSEYHLFRAGRIARSEGTEALGIPARTSLIFLRWNYYLREIAAVWANLILRA